MWWRKDIINCRMAKVECSKTFEKINSSLLLILTIHLWQWWFTHGVSQSVTCIWWCVERKSTNVFENFGRRSLFNFDRRPKHTYGIGNVENLCHDDLYCIIIDRNISTTNTIDDRCIVNCNAVHRCFFEIICTFYEVDKSKSGLGCHKCSLWTTQSFNRST